jgi:hypothetical protein
VPRGGLLVVRSGGRQISLFATGGAVDWSATVANDPGAAISVSPSSGTLTRNGPVATVTVTASQFVPCDSAGYPTLTINPGGTQFFVCTGFARHHGAGLRGQLPSLTRTVPNDTVPNDTVPNDTVPLARRE